MYRMVTNTIFLPERRSHTIPGKLIIMFEFRIFHNPIELTPKAIIWKRGIKVLAKNNFWLFECEKSKISAIIFGERRQTKIFGFEKVCIWKSSKLYWYTLLFIFITFSQAFCKYCEQTITFWKYLYFYLFSYLYHKCKYWKRGNNSTKLTSRLHLPNCIQTSRKANHLSLPPLF